MIHLPSPFHRLVWLAPVLLLVGCGPKQALTAAGPGAPPPPEVGVVTVQPERVTLTTDLPGRTSPFRIAEVRPQVTGVLLKRLFAEGGEVREGEQLYQIDQAPYQAAYDSAQATLAKANAELASAKALRDRYTLIGSGNAVSKQDFDNAVASEMQAEADVASANAAIESARINLVYTKVLSPITGRTGRSVTEGALVTANQSNVLVTVQQLNPIYVDIPQSTALLLRLRRELASGQIKSSGENEAPVTLTLEDGSQYEEVGQLQFSETTVDQSTGSVILRAVFPNPENMLLPGMFVTARLQEGVAENVLLVPQQGVTHDPQGNATALVVTADNKVEMRPIKADRAIGDKWLVSDGLQPGERVIVDGVQKAMPGSTVNPVEAASATATPTSTASTHTP
jgi:membrane fusion protein (multidrug efflux system)